MTASIDRIEAAHEGDRRDVLDLLEHHHLPLDGLASHWDTALVAREAGRVVGCAALEIHQDGALLRSVAVAAGHRGSGLGGALTSAALRLAAERRLPAVYLLTTTAEGFFPRFGFERIARSGVSCGCANVPRVHQRVPGLGHSHAEAPVAANPQLPMATRCRSR
jgi:amino-acid N-acetyltransferase